MRDWMGYTTRTRIVPLLLRWGYEDFFDGVASWIPPNHARPTLAEISRVISSEVGGRCCMDSRDYGGVIKRVPRFGCSRRWKRTLQSRYFAARHVINDVRHKFCFFFECFCLSALNSRSLAQAPGDGVRGFIFQDWGEAVLPYVVVAVKRCEASDG